MKENFQLGISDIIRKIRLKDGLTQKDLAEKLGVSAIAIHSYEKKKRRPGFKFYQKLVKEYPVFRDQIESFALSKTEKDHITERKDMVDSNVNMLVEAQKETIMLQKEKIANLEAENIDMREYPVDSRRKNWDDIQADLQLEMKLKFMLAGPASMKRRYSKVGDLTSLSRATGYSMNELSEMYNTNDWHGHISGGGGQLYSEGSIKRLEELANNMSNALALLKSLVGDHYIPCPINFISKDGTKVKAMSYNRIDLMKMKGYSKLVLQKNNKDD